MLRHLLILGFAFSTLGCAANGSHSSTDGGVDLARSNDPNRDSDGDGFSPSQGDCNDDDPDIYPMAPELCDGKDNDCNGIVDDICDNDHDGYAITAYGKLPGGDCDDQDPLVNPGAMEVAADGVDNNCDGVTDEAIAPCDNGNKGDPMSFAGAIELCAPWVTGAKLNKDADPRAYVIRTSYGTNYKPRQGANFVMLSTGIAADKKDMSWVEPQPGTTFSNVDPNPLPMANNGCGNQVDPNQVNDYVELTLTLKVPTNAQSFSFNFMFVSAEYPEFVGTNFNDKFLAILDSKSYQGNISFDKNMHPITVNAGFFDVCQSAMTKCGQSACTKPVTQLNGTGYEDVDGGGRPVGGGTGWLTTTSPVTPGETATLRFIIFDEGDHQYDSSVIIDNVQFQVQPSMGPSTVG